MKILFRVDANSKIGMGHLQRCLSLAHAFVLQKCTVVFLIEDDIRANERVAQFGFKAYNIESDLTKIDELQTILTFLQRQNFQIIVADSYEFDEDYLFALRQTGCCVIFIDDLATMSFPCHFVVNSSIYAERLDYRSSTGDTKFLLGPKYMLLREEFWNIPVRTIKPKVKKILVTIGGCDQNNVTPTILDILFKIDADFKVDIIVGPFFDNVSDIESAAMQFGNGQVQLFHSPTSVCNVMLDCDLAISGGGQTLYELAATGTPSLAIKLAENQHGNIEGLTQAEAICAIEELNDLRCVVQMLLSDQFKRENMSITGRSLVSGYGAMLVAKSILSFKEGDLVRGRQISSEKN